MTDSTEQIIQRSERASVEFLITDLNVALTFLDVASVSNSPETKRRNWEHARAAYETVLNLLPRISVPHDQRAVLEERFTELRSRLAALGYVLEGAPEDPSST